MSSRAGRWRSIGRAGHRDATHTLAHPEVLTPPATPFGVGVFDFTSKD